MKTIIALIITILSVNVSFPQPICDFLGRDSIVVGFVGDTIEIWDMAACGNCASVFNISVTRSTDSLYIMQEDTTHLTATCECVFNLRATVVGIPAGTYTAVVYRDWHIRYPSMIQPLLIGGIQFEYNPQGTPSFYYTGYQSACGATSVQQKMLQPPEQFALLPNFPNPFNPSTTIRFQTSRTEFVVIKVFDILGREIQTLLSEVKIPGLHNVKFEVPLELSSGSYYYRMYAGSFIQTRTMVLLR